MLYRNMTCEENLAFFGRMYGLENVGERVASVLGIRWDWRADEISESGPSLTGCRSDWQWRGRCSTILLFC